jgi:hypothetical protein
MENLWSIARALGIPYSWYHRRGGSRPRQPLATLGVLGAIFCVFWLFPSRLGLSEGPDPPRKFNFGKAGIYDEEQLFKAIERAERELKVYIYEVGEEHEEICKRPEDQRNCEPCSV